MTAPKGVPLEERRKEMRRRHKNGYRRYGSVSNKQVNMNAEKINVTNVTNVTNVAHVTKVAHVSGHDSFHGNRKKKRRHHGEGERERNPKLTRFCASGGLLDFDAASRMSEDELCEESIHVIKHGAKRIASSWGGVLDSLFSGISEIIEGVFA